MQREGSLSTCLVPYLAFFLLFLGADRDSIYASTDRPTNTRDAPVHCWVFNAFPNITTDTKMVKNFLVVVTIEHNSGP